MGIIDVENRCVRSTFRSTEDHFEPPLPASARPSHPCASARAGTAKRGLLRRTTWARRLLIDEIIIGERSMPTQPKVSRTRPSARCFALISAMNAFPSLPPVLSHSLACVQVGCGPWRRSEVNIHSGVCGGSAVWWGVCAVEGALLLRVPAPGGVRSIPCMLLLLCACGAVVAWSTRRERVTGVRADPGERSERMHDVWCMCSSGVALSGQCPRAHVHSPVRPE